MTKVQIRRLDDYVLPPLQEAVGEFLNPELNSQWKHSKKVLLKPNLLGAFPPERAVTTHPSLLEALILYFLDLGKEVWIGDSPGGTVNVEKVWQTCGLKDLAERYPVKLLNLSTAGYRELVYDDISVKISEVLWDYGIIINIGKLKTHGLVGFTGALKNLFGLVPGLAKSDYHRLYPNTNDFCRLLVAIYQLTKEHISYSFIDGILGMDGPGPSAGRVRKYGLLLGSHNIPALDYIASKLMGFKLKDVPYLWDALHKDGQLISDIHIPTSFQDYKLPDVDIRTVKMSNKFLRYVPRIVRYPFQRLYDRRPVITSRCQKCGICVKSCPAKAISPPDKINLPVIDRKKCIKCLCCHEMCPYEAVDIHKTLLAKMLG
ncbi:MAG TPA: DUF362 domain-containing protein [Candidatus Syntrophosphaera sp.]|jgi:uncharacterized protein (DUF362 family)/Pyruvate/2-oxoacid:ferredoxin oxidoreductase delta subunit|nr:MAG: Ferredoxin [Candidatus Cloacimonetes bacterium ADurb.Bin211]HOD59794.1 DUF362 domain-containing protein [Candidatus Syntrophosphaera sp.]HQM79479.1 DUF362 domain-containing protein [Candidatus Syntrophosphaera sp.]